jgi:hypothetical protein
MNRSAGRSRKWSRHKGVSWIRSSERWRAELPINRKKIQRNVKTEEEAARIYNEFAILYLGTFSRLNTVHS